MTTTMTQTPFLTTTQRAISRMVTVHCKYKWVSYNTADRQIAKKVIMERLSKAPERLSAAQFARGVRDKAFFRSLADAMEDSIWKLL